MTYIDGFVIAVPKRNRDAYRDLALQSHPAFLEFGALQVVECWGDDLPDGKRTDFRRAVAATDDENVVFAWVVWPSKAVRDAAAPRIMADPRMQPDGEMPFDGARLIYGGFETLVDSRA
jgi:uncharacterized protein YbaA (DUF1428 family)